MALSFDAASNGPFEEGTSQTIELKETLFAAFGMFVSWIYTQNLAVYRDQCYSERSTTFEEYKAKIRAVSTPEKKEALQANFIDARHKSIPAYYQELLNLWVLADRLLIPVLQNEVMDMMYSLVDREPFFCRVLTYTFRNTVYAKTADGCPYHCLHTSRAELNGDRYRCTD